MATARVLAEMIQAYRRHAKGIPPEQLNYVDHWDLREPAQIFDYHVGPVDHHLLTIIHSGHAPDGLVKTIGPLDFLGLKAALIGTLEDSIWDQTASYDRPHLYALHRPRVAQTLPIRSHQKRALAFFYRNIQSRAFHDFGPSKGFSSGNWDCIELGHIEWKGNLEFDPENEVRQEIQRSVREFKQRAEFVPRPAPPPLVGPPSRERWQGVWTTLWPPLNIGQSPEPTFDELAFNYKPHASDRTDFKEDPGRQLSYTYDGIVALTNQDEEMAVRILNLLAFAITTQGVPVSHIGALDYGMFRRGIQERASRGLGSMAWPVSPDRGLQTPAIPDLWTGLEDAFGRPRVLTEDQFLQAYNHAVALAEVPLWQEALLLLQAETWKRQAHYTNAFLFAWFCIESLAKIQLDEYLTSLGNPAGIVRAFERASMYRISHVLKDATEPFQLLDFKEFDYLRVERNGLIHKDPAGGEYAATRAIRYAWRLLNPRLPKALQHEPAIGKAVDEILP